MTALAFGENGNDVHYTFPPPKLNTRGWLRRDVWRGLCPCFQCRFFALPGAGGAPPPPTGCAKEEAEPHKTAREPTDTARGAHGH